VLQCVAVCCSVLQCVAVCCSVSKKNRVRTHFVIELCSFECVYSFLIVSKQVRHKLDAFFDALQHTATHRNTPQHPATHCDAVQYSSTHCNRRESNWMLSDTLHLTATHCNTLRHPQLQQVRDKLDAIGFSERTLFPGLDGLCNYLRRSYTLTKNAVAAAVC